MLRDQKAHRSKRRNAPLRKGMLFTLIVALVITFSACSAMPSPDLTKSKKAADYEKAMAAMKAQDYKQAIGLFGELDDYEDSAIQMRRAKWGLLYQYIENNGEVTEYSSGYKSLKGSIRATGTLSGTLVSLYFTSKDCLTVEYDGYLVKSYSNDNLSITDLYSGEMSITFEADKVAATLEESATISGQGKKMTLTESYKGSFFPKTYTGENDISIDSFVRTGINFKNENLSSHDADTAILPDLTALSYPVLIDAVIRSVSELINGTSLGISIKDFGFSRF